MKKKRIMIRILWILVLLGVLTECAIILTVHFNAIKAYPSEHRDVAIVLGARVQPDSTLSTTLEHRIEKGLAVYQEGWVQKIIVCGAQGADEPMTEAQAMRDYLVAHGVPESDILMEDRSTSTIENLSFAMEIMAANDWHTAMLVTSDYHLTRALWLAEDVGLDAIGASAKGPNLWYNQWIARGKESLSWIKYFFTMRLFA